MSITTNGPTGAGRTFWSQARETPLRRFLRTETGSAAVVLSQSLARRLFPGEDAAGKRVSFGAGEPWYTVVGIAADVKNAGLTERPDPEYYLVRRHGNDPVYATQVLPFGWRAASVVVRTSLDAHATAESLRCVWVGAMQWRWRWRGSCGWCLRRGRAWRRSRRRWRRGGRRPGRRVRGR